jgi:hypothetical protein
VQKARIFINGLAKPAVFLQCKKAACTKIIHYLSNK